MVSPYFSKRYNLYFLLEMGVHWVGLRKVLGMKLIPDDSDLKFLEKRKPLMIGSLLLIIGGMVFTGMNVKNIFGIDFTIGRFVDHDFVDHDFLGRGEPSSERASDMNRPWR